MFFRKLVNEIELFVENLGLYINYFLDPLNMVYDQNLSE